MNISGDYGTELLLRYTEERLQNELEHRRVADERAAEHRRENGTRPLPRFARFFLRGQVAAGGPEWVRPAIQAEPVVRPAVRPEVPTPMNEQAPPQEPVSTTAHDAITAAADERMPSRTVDERMPSRTVDERMPSRTLVGTRR